MPYDEDLDEDEQAALLAQDDSAGYSVPQAPLALAPRSPAPQSESDMVKQFIASQQKDREFNAQSLRDAQRASSDTSLGVNLGDAGANIGYAIAGVKNPNPGAFADLKKQANAPVENFEQGRKLESEDQKNQQDVRNFIAKLEQQKTAQVNADTRFQETKRHNAVTESKPSYAQVIGDVTTQRNDNQVHQKVVQGLKNDKDLNQRLNQYKNLDNALSIVVKADKLTTQQIQEFQQAVRGNLGIKGGSGVGEREATYLDSIGLRSSAFQQFLTGDPAQIAQDNELVKHLKNLASVEQQNIRAQKDQRLKLLTSGYDTVYKRHPELKKDLDAAVENAGAQFQSNVQPRAPQAASPHKPGDLVSVKGVQYKVGDDGDSLEPVQ